MKNEENFEEEIARGMRRTRTFNMLLYTAFSCVFLRTERNFNELVEHEDKLREFIEHTFKIVKSTNIANTTPSVSASEIPFHVLNKDGIKIIGIELPDAVIEPQSKYIAYIYGNTEPLLYSYEVYTDPSDLELCYADKEGYRYSTCIVFNKCDNIKDFVENVYKYTLEKENNRLEKAK